MRPELPVVQTDGDCAVINLRWLPKRAEGAAELVEAAAELNTQRDHRVAMVFSSGEDFCEGLAPGVEATAVHPNPAEAIAALRVPVVAVVGGRCDGVGLEIALACDIRLAAEDAQFSLNAAEGEFPCWGGTQRLPRAVGHARASAMLMLGETVDAATALEWGLVHQVCGDEAATVAAAEQLCATLAERAPFALELAKEAVHRGTELPLADGLRLEGDLNHLLASTDDRAEGLASFFEKRQPRFRGR